MPNKKRQYLKTLISKEGPGLMMPGAYNPLIAKLVEKKGFKGAYISGAALSASMGFPDIGLLSGTDFAEIARHIAASVNIPCICDADTGFGGPINVYHTVKMYEEIGLAGLHLEDQVMPKRCGHLKGKELITVNEMCEKIKAGIKARRDPNFLIIARTDARGVTNIEDAIVRAKFYVEAGADVIFPEALKNEKEFEIFANEISVPLLANMTEFGVSLLIPAANLIKMGYKIVIFPVSTLRSSLKACEELLETIQAQGTQKESVEKMLTRIELYDLIEYEKYGEIDKSVSGYK